MPDSKQSEINWQDCPTAWFAMLERARRTGDRELEREAMQGLRRLGVHVCFQDDIRAESTAAG